MKVYSFYEGGFPFKLNNVILFDRNFYNSIYFFLFCLWYG